MATHATAHPIGSLQSGSRIVVAFIGVQKRLGNKATALAQSSHNVPLNHLVLVNNQQANSNHGHTTLIDPVSGTKTPWIFKCC